MEWLKNFIEERRQKHNEHRKNEIAKRSVELFQLTEYNNKIWLMYAGHLIAPCTMLCKEDSPSEYIVMLNSIRELYQERNNERG